jgi:uncharacterized protein YndB with AHSA1/START domain
MTSLTLVRLIEARPSVVFDALTTSDGVAEWWGPDDLPVIAAEMDARVGGAFRIRFRTIDGGVHESSGEFLEIVPTQRLIMTMRFSEGGVAEEQGATSRVEIELRPVETGTELTFTHIDLRNAESAASHLRGWTCAFDKLARRFANSNRRRRAAVQERI